jgi:hypothetical protein
MSVIKSLIKELEQAKKTCPRCNGSGVITAPEWEIYWELRREVEKRIKKENPDKPGYLIYEETKHILPEVDEETLCTECEGDGYILSEDAFELICLLRSLFSKLGL